MHTVAEVMFPLDDAHVVLALGRSLAAQPLAVEAVTELAMRASSADALAEDVADLATELAWRVERTGRGGATVMTLVEP